MGKGYTGDSKEDIAYRNVERTLRKHRGEYKRPPSNLLESLQAAFPDTWKEELDKMRKEYAAERNKSNS